VRLRAIDVGISELFGEISRQSGLKFSLSPRVSKTITVEVEKPTLVEVVSSIVKLADLVEKVEGGIHFVYSKEDLKDLAEIAKKEPTITIGASVVTKGETAIQAEGAVDKGSKFRVYKVVGTLGADQIFIENTSDNVRGSISTDQVVALTRAIEYFTDRMRAAPNQSVGYAARGNIWFALEEYDIAIADYDEAARLDPKNAIVFNNRAYCRWKKKVYDKALADYNEAIRIQPSFGAVYNNRSLLLATSPGATAQDVTKAVTTAHVWTTNDRSELDLLDALARACAGSNTSKEVRAWVARLDNTEAKTYFLAQLDHYERARPKAK